MKKTYISYSFHFVELKTLDINQPWNWTLKRRCPDTGNDHRTQMSSLCCSCLIYSRVEAVKNWQCGNINRHRKKSQDKPIFIAKKRAIIIQVQPNTIENVVDPLFPHQPRPSREPVLLSSPGYNQVPQPHSQGSVRECYIGSQGYHLSWVVRSPPGW